MDCHEQGLSKPYNCSMGFYCDDPAVDPKPCEIGYYNSYERASKKSECLPCDSDKTTEYEAANSKSFCKCSKGYYSVTSESQICVKCQEGLSCINIGTTLDNVTAVEGFYYKPGDDVINSNLTFSFGCQPKEACTKNSQCNTTLGYKSGSFMCSEVYLVISIYNA